MFANQLEHKLSTWISARLLGTCSKIIPWLGKRDTDVPLRNDLERLALSAPHMLSDIGFERDDKACSPEKVVWRRGKLCVIIANSTQTTIVTV
ncbi:hypothetical protein [Phaeobacter sp. 22II1-1F12B]|uniref:hypothetical protein n=1 Tax=Phaeobacter sp. 22II1-1F12B TaxID=1317111 RepID=UPI000B524EAA|nr:hypothetical protein [Phaeobacter sp. 22II1-1F12B]OWU67348.1 hypothetical protein ATO1_25750 [Phaeobacter sp. 22II1-1F12B]